MADPRGIVRAGSSSLISRVDRRRQLVAFGTISGLVLLAFGLWFVAILTSSDRDQLEIAEGPTADAERPVAEEPDREAPDPTTAERFDLEPDTDPEPDTDVEAVTIDGVCTVELDAAERDATPLRAWEYADCAHAPVPLDDGGERWIVIRASMPSGDVDAAAAQERARDLGVDGGVLWSSHYPSLNPDFWVAYDGPFPDAEGARSAAEAVDGEAYARALTTDGGDR